MSIFHDPASLMHQARKQLQEKTLTPAETKKKEEIVKSMKSSASDFEKRYPGRGKEVMYATATKQAKKVAEDTENIDEKVGLSIVSAGEPKYDRNEQGEVKINPANALRFAGKKLSKAAGVKKKIRIRIGEEVGEIEIEEGMTMKEELPVRKRGGRSAPEDQRSIGGQPNRDNKDYWASVEG